MEKRELEHSYICRLFLEGVTIFFVLSTAVTLISAIYLCLQPESGIVLKDTGYSYRFELLVGYAQCGYEHLPLDVNIVSSKIFCISFLLLSLVTKDLPILVMLYYFRRILNTIRKSHSPFVPAITEDTKMIGKVLILVGIFGGVILQMGLGLIAYHVPYIENPLEFSWIFAGIIVLLAADILNWGCELQTFSDETL